MLSSKPFISRLNAFIEDEKLPPDYAAMAGRYFLPLAEQLLAIQTRLQHPLLVGINGAQGTGKSTLAALLTHWFNTAGRRCVALSIDDIYLTRTERAGLAASVHPLLATRGVPGTHDIGLGIDVIEQLRHATPDQTVAIPRFDKAADDRCPPQHWEQHRGSADIIILEGWCVCARLWPDSPEPINELERTEDSDGRWRDYIRRQLAGQYAQLFEQIDYLVMLKAPSMQCVVEWRTLQEQKLAEKLLGNANNNDGFAPKSIMGAVSERSMHQIMSKNALKRFIMHYERLTRQMLQYLPDSADTVFEIGMDHQIIRAYSQPSGTAG